MMENKTIRIRRVGSVTFGIGLVILGVIMIVSIFFPSFNAVFLFRFWPVILVILGIEVLIGSHYKSTEIINPDERIIEQSKVIYDIPAVIMLAVTLVITFMLAWAKWYYYAKLSP